MTKTYWMIINREVLPTSTGTASPSSIDSWGFSGASSQQWLITNVRF